MEGEGEEGREGAGGAVIRIVPLYVYTTTHQPSSTANKENSFSVHYTPTIVTVVAVAIIYCSFYTYCKLYCVVCTDLSFAPS